MIYIKAGRRIRMFRTAAGMTQFQLAETLSCSESFISLVENGKKRASVEFYITVANYFSISLDEIFRESINFSKNIILDTALLKMSYMGEKQQKLLLKIIEDVGEMT